MAAIEVEELCRTYRSRKGVIRRKRTDVHALRGISFEVEQGELFGCSDRTAPARPPRSRS